jgi:hypothetical protein
MHSQAFETLTEKVAAVCDQHRVPVRLDDQARLETALWRFVQPALVGTTADPYVEQPDPDEPGQECVCLTPVPKPMP